MGSSERNNSLRGSPGSQADRADACLIDCRFALAVADRPLRRCGIVWFPALPVLFMCWLLSGEGVSASRLEVDPSQGDSAATGDLGLFSVGVATVDVTPSYPVRLNGFGGRRLESQGVRQPLWAKALAIGKHDEDTIVIITVDTLGIPDQMTERLAERLECYGLDRSRLAICASHTHSGPMIRDCANTLFGEPIPESHWENILRYSDELEHHLEQVAVEALESRRPARLSWGKGTVGFAMNRRTAGGPVDHDLPLLAVHDLEGGLQAVLVNYACHCVTLSDDLISGDWAGYAMEHIQRRHPGCVALISIGCGADANPRGGVLGSRADVADHLGWELSEEVQRLLNRPLTPVTSTPRSIVERVDLPLAPLPDREYWENLSTLENAVGHHARTQLERLNRGEELMTSISYPIQTVSFGDELALVFLPGEVVVDYALRLKQELDGNRLWINAYSNACPGYIPSERILSEGGYEAGGAMIYYDIPVPYASGVEELIVREVRRQLEPEFSSRVETSRTNGIPPRSAEESLRFLHTKPGFRVELAASEPLTESPVAIAWGTDGRLWVAEMLDYPQGREDGSGGQIRCLFDDNGDGKFDRSEVFLGGLPFPTGVTAWRDGVLICAAPDILFAADTNGDGRADHLERLYTGFATHNFQARVNSLEYGLDGWVYGSCGLFGGEITCLKTGEVVSLGQRDFRIDPDSGALEPASGATQQGRVRNDHDDWFGCNNSVLLMHYPLPDHYLRRNPFLKAGGTVVGIAAGPEPGRLFSVSDQVLFELSGPPGRPTAACGLGIYRDSLLGDSYAQNVFTCEPVNNLVHRQILEARGASFVGRRDDDELDREFLASSDPWFRPVQVRTGLDGALWIVDMYRYVIEHPIWIPPQTLANLDPRAGADRGRIYRVFRDKQVLHPITDLSGLRGADLATQMETTNGPRRDLVQQLIQWNDDRESIPVLRALFSGSRVPEVRLQALCTLANLDALSAELLFLAMQDSDPAVRRHAVRAAEPLLNSSPDLANELLRLADDPDPQVRLQVAWSAWLLPAEYSTAVLSRILSSGEADPHITTAVESSLSSANVVLILDALTPADDFDRTETTVPMAGSTSAREMILLNLAVLADSAVAREFLLQLCREVDPLQGRESVDRLARFIEAIQKRPDGPLVLQDGEVLTTWKQLAADMECLITDQSAPEDIRQAAIGLIGHGPALGTDHIDCLMRLLSLQTSPALQATAVDTLGRIGSDQISQLLLKDWDGREPALRRQILDVLLSRAPWTRELLREIGEGTVLAAELDLSQQQSLLDNSEREIRELAAGCFAPRTSAGRQEAIARYAAELNQSGDPVEGRRLFEKHCAGCHRVQEFGHAVGPEIAGYSIKPPESLLIAILDPNQAVDPRYQAWVVALNDGRTLTGIIAEEGASSLTLLAAEGKRETILRSEIEQLRGTGKSLMPEGFEQHATPADLNHLWAYFRSLSIPPKTIAGNRPQEVVIPPNGPVALMASQAEIYGREITFEPPFQNIGYWHGVDDFVRWRIRHGAAREVAVWAEWACDPGSAGNTFHLEGIQPPLMGTVASTGGWNRYQLVYLGQGVIPAGTSEIVMRPSETLRAALTDLRAIHFVSIGSVPLATGVVAQATSGPSSTNVRELAATLLDPGRTDAEREALIAEHLSEAADLILQMAADLPEAAGSPEEYRRIPWIWRVAVAAGQSGDNDIILQVLRGSLPAEGQRLEHWQAVVIGGGLINGLSLTGKWPEEHFRTLLRDDEHLQQLWQRALKLSLPMCDDESVPTGTRYDALRMIAMLSWNDARSTFERYLAAGVHDELQMGAVSGLSDVASDDVADLLIEAWPHLSDHNRTLALEALVRTPLRSQHLLRGLEASRLPKELKSNELVRSLRTHSDPEIRLLAEQVLRE